MTAPCDEIQANAAGLASLRADDPERQAAEAHARTCKACAAALREGAAVLALVDHALPLEEPRAEALARVSAQILRELGAAASPRRWRLSGGAVAAMAGAWGACWLLGAAKHFGSGVPLLVSAGLALVAAGLGAAVLTWGRALVPVIPALAITFAVVGGGGAGLQPDIGAHCALFELALAAVPLVLAYLLARRGGLGSPTLALSAAAGAGALAAQAALHVACHAEPSLSHALVFHALPVVLALGIGAVAGARTTARQVA